MKNTANPSRELPTLEQLETELDREKYKKRYRRVLRSTVYTLVVVAAVAVLVATIWMPVLQIYGASMAPTLDEGDIVISVKGSDFAPGDLVAFYMGNKILVKRCIAGPGQWVDIDVEGNVYVDGNLLDEPYLTEKYHIVRPIIDPCARHCGIAEKPARAGVGAAARFFHFNSDRHTASPHIALSLY